MEDQSKKQARNEEINSASQEAIPLKWLEDLHDHYNELGKQSQNPELARFNYTRAAMITFLIAEWQAQQNPEGERDEEIR